jgi:hypothetical protein
LCRDSFGTLVQHLLLFRDQGHQLSPVTSVNPGRCHAAMICTLVGPIPALDPIS